MTFRRESDDMGGARSDARADRAMRPAGWRAAALRAADPLSLAAAPAFATMALIAEIPGAGQPEILCSVAQGALPLSGMTVMYLLMSVFHLPPWLRLIFGRRHGARRG
jgi:hypothetical protein